jgi:hypothetical protein
MASAQQDNQPTMQGPATYRIRVSGSVDPQWADRVSGMQTTHLTRLRGKTESVLVGRLADQAALNGFLSALYERHLPVISVECLEGQESE